MLFISIWSVCMCLCAGCVHLWFDKGIFSISSSIKRNRCICLFIIYIILCLSHWFGVFTLLLGSPCQSLLSNLRVRVSYRCVVHAMYSMCEWSSCVANLSVSALTGAKVADVDLCVSTSYQYCNIHSCAHNSLSSYGCGLKVSCSWISI